MAHWIEVPAHRIYVCSIDEFEKRFSRFSADGQICNPFEVPEMLLREDGKRFKYAKFLPVAAAALEENLTLSIYLEEI